jgi:5-hydroxyisourate hydrolase
MDQLRPQRQEATHRIYRSWRLVLPGGGKVQVAYPDRQVRHVRRIAVADPRPTISTHVLDLELGVPAVGLPVALFRLEEDGRPELLTELVTDADGRIRSLLAGDLELGDYQLVFDLAAYAATLDRDADFFENLAVGIRIDDAERSYHVPLLLSPFGISAYRGT